MTANQITKKLTAAGIIANAFTMLIPSRDEIEVCILDDDDAVDTEATDRLRGKVVKALGWTKWNGYRCGYGAWVVRPGAAQKDYEGVAARMHY